MTEFTQLIKIKTNKKVKIMNIYEMYYENNKKFGFWIQRNTWGNTVAQVHSIEGVIEGNDIIGRKPYYNNPKVYAIYHKIDDIQNNIFKKPKIKDLCEVRCPGTYAYRILK